jgi:hypothetical protein
MGAIQSEAGAMQIVPRGAVQRVRVSANSAVIQFSKMHLIQT